jgi:sugar/nucleoside kinase (ribokinase family)
VAVDTTGAGDALTGVLVASLGASGFDPGTAARALPRAVSVAALSTTAYGATDSLPAAIDIGLDRGTRR